MNIYLPYSVFVDPQGATMLLFVVFSNNSDGEFLNVTYNYDNRTIIGYANLVGTYYVNVTATNTYGKSNSTSFSISVTTDPAEADVRLKIAMVVIVSSCLMGYFVVRVMDDNFTIRAKMMQANKAKFLQF